MDTFIISDGLPQADQRVSTTTVQVVTKASHMTSSRYILVGESAIPSLNRFFRTLSSIFLSSFVHVYMDTLLIT